MATKKQHFEAPRLSDFDLEILPLAKKLVYVQKKAFIVFGNALRIWGVTYGDFKKAPYDLLNAFHEDYREITEDAEKTPTLEMEMEVLKIIFNAQISIDKAFDKLKKRDVAEAAFLLASGSAWVGQLMVYEDLYDRDVLFSLDAISRAKEGAQRGGLASAKTRRDQAKLPQPAILKKERDELIEKGKPHREIASMLAKKYLCTPDHIRKTLKRD
jgi:hypothetical protein